MARLIDADALKEMKFSGGMRDDYWIIHVPLREVMENIDEAPTVGGWVSVKDRLPDTEDHVLCCTQTKAGRQNVVIGYYMDGAWRCGMNSNVTHWMPLPEAPKGVSVDA